ncbi:MAG: TraR/DksA C4-type zinc finger protein [Planctomycetota bacterium]
MGKKKTKINKLSSAQTKKFKVMLLVKRSEILGDVSSMEAEALRRNSSNLSSMPVHMADIGTDNYEIENTLGLMESERKILVEIDDALGRIEDGTYGICQGNGEPISEQRLEAIPWARYCVTCAGMVERGTGSRQQFYKNSGSDSLQHDNSNESSEDYDGEDFPLPDQDD